MAHLQATIATIAHHERPDYLDRLSVLRDQVFVLDHMYMSLFSHLRLDLALGVTVALLMSIHPALLLLAVFALPDGADLDLAAGRRARRRGARAHRPIGWPGICLPPRPRAARARRCGSPASGRAWSTHRRAAWERWYGRSPRRAGARRSGTRSPGRSSASAYVGAVSSWRPGSRDAGSDVLLVLAAGARLSALHRRHRGRDWISAGSGMDGSRRLAWLEDYAAATRERGRSPVPGAGRAASASRHVSFTYPGTARGVLEDVILDTAGRFGGRAGRRKRRRQNHAGQAARPKFYEPTVGRILVDGIDLRRLPADEWRGRLAGAVPGFLPLRVPGPPHGRRGRRARAWTTRRPWWLRSTAPAPPDVVERLPAGLETQLGPTWPNGVELSFGQWQKLALARGLHARRSRCC